MITVITMETSNDAFAGASPLKVAGDWASKISGCRWYDVKHCIVGDDEAISAAGIQCMMDMSTAATTENHAKMLARRGISQEIDR
ncbi:MAG TPA: hypothetical protein VGM77_11235 [Gemmatimonadales bacterium]|jgi:hypothetical protein